MLYVGEASTSLRSRLGAYLIHDIGRKPDKGPGAKPRRDHKGKLFVFHVRDTRSDSGVFLRWIEYGGWTREMEATLIDHYQPMYNSRDESLFTAPLGRMERFDPRLLRMN